MPQLEDGYLKIANELWDALTKFRMPGECRMVLDTIIRKTYGFNKKIDRISISQFRLSTSLPDSSIIRAINKLLAHGLIYKTVNSMGASYGIIKKYSAWKPFTKQSIVYKTVNPNLQNGKSEFTKQSDTKDTLTKDTLTKDIIPLIPFLDYFPEDWQEDEEFKEAWVDWLAFRSEIKKKLTPRAAKAQAKFLQSQGLDAIAIIRQSIQNSYQGLFELKRNGKQPKSYTKGAAEWLAQKEREYAKE